ncbi:protoglobin domain-containing protein [Parapedomonas caeni]
MSTNRGIVDRVRFFGISESDCQLLRAARERIDNRIAPLLQSLYVHMLAEPALAPMLHGRVDGLQKAQHAHWLTLLEGRFDDEYHNRATAIGNAHERIGLEPKWYIGAYARALDGLTDIIAGEALAHQPDVLATLKAVQKATLLDMELAVSVYIEAGQAKLDRELQAVADRIEQEVQGAVSLVSAQGETMRQSAHAMAGDLAEASSASLSMVDAVTEASSYVQGCAVAIEEMTASVHEIARQVHEARGVSGKVSAEIDAITHTVAQLGQAASQIGEVVQLISQIASQTNLLALNATIEAARAGEAGRGFAVVASEVKTLATQTAQATKSVHEQVGSIQSIAERAAQAVAAIADTIERNNTVTSTVAAAVEEQNHAGVEISRNIQKAAQTAQRAADGMSKVAGDTRRSGCQAENMVGNVAGVKDGVDVLESRVRDLLVSLRR